MAVGYRELWTLQSLCEAESTSDFRMPSLVMPAKVRRNVMLLLLSNSWPFSACFVRMRTDASLPQRGDAHQRERTHPLSLGTPERRALAGQRPSGVAQLRIPVGPASFRCKIEQIPLWVDGIDVARVLPRFGRRVEELGAPEVADRFTVAPEHVEHRHLSTLRVLAEIVAVVGSAGRGQQPQPPPAARLRMGKDARKFRLGDDHEIDALGDVLR